MKFAHTADNHLGYRQYNLLEREQDFYDSFNEMIDKIIEERVDFVIHSGDLFESPKPSIKTLLEALRGLKRLKEKGIDVYAIPGNHDMSMHKGSLSPHMLFKDMIRFIGGEEKFCTRGDVFIGGAGYYSRCYSNALVGEMNSLSGAAEGYGTRILMLHQGFDRYLPFEGSFELKIGDLPDNFDYYALGHIHKRIKTDYGRGKLVYPGSTEIWNIDEYGDYKRNGKGFYVVDMSGEEPGVEPINLEGLRTFIKDKFHVMELSERINDIKNNVIQLKNRSMKKPVLYLNISGKAYDMPAVHNKINSFLEDDILSLRSSYSYEHEGHVLSEMSLDRFDIPDLIGESFGNESEANFATHLFAELSSSNLEGARDSAREFYKEFRSSNSN